MYFYLNSHTFTGRHDLQRRNKRSSSQQFFTCSHANVTTMPIYARLLPLTYPYLSSIYYQAIHRLTHSSHRARIRSLIRHSRILRTTLKSHHKSAFDMSDPANLITHADGLAEHGRVLQEIGTKLQEMAGALRAKSAAWTQERAHAAKVEAELRAELTRATRGVCVNVNVGVGTGHGHPHPRTSVNTSVNCPGLPHRAGRVEEIED
jgi:hypothetical protein